MSNIVHADGYCRLHKCPITVKHSIDMILDHRGWSSYRCNSVEGYSIVIYHGSRQNGTNFRILENRFSNKDLTIGSIVNKEEFDKWRSLRQ